mgnify:CR=1 FL=1|tara:strand:- start:8378 stop:9919 length:1542 start_codon:yes stop_codon:yes gene_type:complete
MKNAKALYTELETTRFPFLERARDCSRVTLPTVVPDEGITSHKKFPTPYQGVGARGVNNLASSLLLSLLPPNAPFFRLVLDDQALKQLEGAPDIKTEVEQSLASIEKAVMKEVEVNNIRVALFECLKQLIIAGNCLLHFPDEGGVRVFPMSRYVIKRDPMGNPLHMVTKESVSPLALPEEIRNAIPTDSISNDSVDLYTCIHREPNGKCTVYQEVGDAEIPGTRGTYNKDEVPFLPLRMYRVEGEDWGRSYVEQYLGDLRSLEGLTQAIVEGAAAASKILFMVSPNGTTRARTLAKSPNGAIVEGSAADVTVLQSQKSADLSIAASTAQTITDRLAYAFLLTESTVRRAERVTAEEIRLVTQSIERQLGGAFSLLSQELQLPLVNRMMKRLQKKKKLPKLPKKYISPAIITGIEALGRGNDLNRLDFFLQGMAQTVGAEAIGQFVNMREYIKRRATALGIDTLGLIKTEEQLMQEAQQAQQDAVVQQYGGQVMDIADKQFREAQQLEAAKEAE